MKKCLVFIACSLTLAFALSIEASESLIRYLPRDSFVVAGADFGRWQNNDVYQTLEKNNQIWSYDEGEDGVAEYLKLLKLDTKKDIDSFAFSKYVNSYGGSGKLYLFNLTRDISRDLATYPSTPYLQIPLYRISSDRDMYAVALKPFMIAVGNLNEAKMAVDVMKEKVPSVPQNAILSTLYTKIPAQAGVWGVSLPLSRRKAADAHAKQSTNSMISGFQSYYFYGIPTKTDARTQFFGQTADEKQASFISSFMIGTLLVTKLKADDTLGEALDQVDVQHEGNNVHVTMVITKELVNAYYKGKLGF
jgi:hypothetical protein